MQSLALATHQTSAFEIGDQQPQKGQRRQCPGRQAAQFMGQEGRQVGPQHALVHVRGDGGQPSGAEPDAAEGRDAKTPSRRRRPGVGRKGSLGRRRQSGRVDRGFDRPGVRIPIVVGRPRRIAVGRTARVRPAFDHPRPLSVFLSGRPEMSGTMIHRPHLGGKAPSTTKYCG